MYAGKRKSRIWVYMPQSQVHTSEYKGIHIFLSTPSFEYPPDINKTVREY